MNLYVEILFSRLPVMVEIQNAYNMGWVINEKGVSSSYKCNRECNDASRVMRRGQRVLHKLSIIAVAQMHNISFEQMHKISVAQMHNISVEQM